MNPNCLDNPTIAPILRNIYLCVWHLMNKEDEESENERKIHLSPLMKYILFSMNLDSSSPHNSLEMNKFINDYKFAFDKEEEDGEISNDLSSGYQKLRFLKCAAIFDHFVRNIKIAQTNKFIDWDEYLEQSFLFKYYNIQMNEKKNNEKIMNANEKVL